jgi:hypothetical protein
LEVRVGIKTAENADQTAGLSGDNSSALKLSASEDVGAASGLPITCYASNV